MIQIAELLEQAKSTPSDINEHVEFLYQLGRQCPHITEFGVRYGVSTLAWLAAKPLRLRCYDISLPPRINLFNEIAQQEQIDFRFIQADTRNVSIEHTDLLFIDTLHTRDQVAAELYNSVFVSKFIVLHDTELFGWNGEHDQMGIRAPIMDLILSDQQWTVSSHHAYNNGLTVLSRKVPLL